ncbi:hypothetical protein Y032_0213g2288 [Ancylostoma ceylanicum]|uniref:Secreted protein n=1 Tax=Ancylostoma ceylanicum TaxID=53326 RepID=A0A016SKH4_9BILA|nr:hypothetical protein Y032_0213g2288 [Ancylostoma ceylanicum]
MTIISRQIIDLSILSIFFTLGARTSGNIPSRVLRCAELECVGLLVHWFHRFFKNTLGDGWKHIYWGSPIRLTRIRETFCTNLINLLYRLFCLRASDERATENTY